MATGRIELGPTGRQVAANVNRLREAQGLTLRGLSARLKELGRPLSADALNKIENGRPSDDLKDRPVRRVDADDLVALAIALKVNPSALLLPPRSDAEPVEITGGGAVSGVQAWEWADGEWPLERIEPGDPNGHLLLWNFYARPPGRRASMVPEPESEGGDG